MPPRSPGSSSSSADCLMRGGRWSRRNGTKPGAASRAPAATPACSHRARRAVAQTVSADSAAFYKALELESAGKYREAVALYRASMRGENTVNAFMGLERVMNELGWLDSLLAPIDSLVRAVPAERVYRVAQL